MITPEGGDVTLLLTSDIRMGLEGPSVRARTRLKEGETRFCALSWGSHTPPADYEDAAGPQIWTAHHWQHWLSRGRFPDHRWRSYLTRSALTLKGLTFAPTGAIAAAATTSLPEPRRAAGTGTTGTAGSCAAQKFDHVVDLPGSAAWLAG